MPTALDALARKSLVQIRLDRNRYLGVGFVIAPGLVVTNAHVAADGLEVWFGGKAHACTEVRRYPAERAGGAEWPWPDLAEVTVPTLEAEPVLLGPPVAGAQDVEKLGEVWVPTFDLAYVDAGPDRLEPITARLRVSITGDGLIGLGGGTLERGMSGSPVIDMRSGRVRGVVKSAAWAQAPVRHAAAVPTGGFMIPLTEADTPPDWFTRNAAVNPLGNPWRRAAADAARVQEDLFEPDEPPGEVTPANLLDPDARYAPFEAVAALDDLLAWCRTEGPTIVRLFSAESGTGKSRISGELCRVLRAEGWAAGFFDPAADEWRHTLVTALARELQICIVVDDAEHRGGQIREILQTARTALNAARTDRSRVTVRVLLLSRVDPDRFDRAFLVTEAVTDNFARWLRPVRGAPILLPPAPPDPRGSLLRAWRAFGSLLGVRTDTEPLWRSDLGGMTILELHAVAADEVLSALPGYERRDRLLDDPLQTLRDHHLRYWAQKLKNARYRLTLTAEPEEDSPYAGSESLTLPLAAAEAWLLVPTMSATSDEDRLLRTMGRVAQALGTPARTELKRLLRLYPKAGDGRSAALTPDRLAEIVLRHVCRDLDELTLCAFLAAVLVGEDADVPLALRLICRSRADPDATGDAAHERIDAALTTLLAEHPGELLPALTRVCGEIPNVGPLVGLLTATAKSADLQVLQRVEVFLPDDGRGLSPLAIVVLERQADATSGNDDRSRQRRVSWWRKLGLHQYHLGLDAALDTNRDAINECRILRARGAVHAATFAQLHDDRALFLLRRLQSGRPGRGDIDDALVNGQIAIKEYEKLLPDYRTALADVLHNQDILFTKAGRPLQALECGEKALGLYGETGPRRPRAAAYLQVARDRSAAGLVQAALTAADESVAILTELFGETPSAYAADLVRALAVRALIHLQKAVHDRNEGDRDGSAGLISARADVTRARQVMRRWLPVPEPDLEDLLRRVEAVLERRLG